jgi:hypothetical protein
MKISFFSWSAVGMLLAASCFLSSCKKELSVICEPDDQRPVEFRILNGAHENLIGYKSNQFNPTKVKLSYLSDNVWTPLPIHYWDYNGALSSKPIEPYHGFMFAIPLTKSNFESMESVAKNHGGKYDFTYLLQLNSLDSDTIIFRYDPENGKSGVFFNNEKAYILEESLYHFFKGKK